MPHQACLQSGGSCGSPSCDSLPDNCPRMQAGEQCSDDTPQEA